MANTQLTVIFCTATNTITDVVNARAGETPDAAITRLQARYGTALQAMPYDRAAQLYESAFKTPVQEISSEDYHYALGCLFPDAWTHGHAATSFKMAERTAGLVTAIYVATSARYFRFHDDVRTPHEECCQRVAAFIAAHAPPPAAHTHQQGAEQ